MMTVRIFNLKSVKEWEALNLLYLHMNFFKCIRTFSRNKAGGIFIEM